MAEPSLEVEAGLAELERLLLGREYAAAVEAGEGLLAAGSLKGMDEAKARLWLGASLIGASRPSEAIPHLRTARDSFQELDDAWLEAEAMDYEAVALHVQEAPGAVAMAEAALAKCRSLQPAPPLLEARILGHLGAFFVRHRQWKPALAAYREALGCAPEIRDLRQLAMMHHNLSIAYSRLGRPAEARASAERALALYSAQSAAGDLARMQSDLGDLLMRQGDLKGAETALDSALGIFAATADHRGEGYAVLTMAEVALAQGALARSRRRLDRARAMALRSGETLLQACVAQVRARLARAEGDQDGASAAFEEAIALFQDLGHAERLAEASLEYGELLQACGDVDGALEHMRRAARAAIYEGSEVGERPDEAEPAAGSTSTG